MHVLTLIGCVLFSDVGLRDRGRRRGKDRGGGGVDSERCVCVCGLDEPPEFSQQLWSVLGKKRKNEKSGNKVRPGGNQGPKSNLFPPLALCVYFVRLLCFNTGLQ